MTKLLLPLAAVALLAAPTLAAPGHPEADKHQASVLLPGVTIEAPTWARHPAPHHAPAPRHPRR